MWETVIFPSNRPSGRKEVKLLDQWLNTMLHQNLLKSEDPLGGRK
jgi:hypothetical protein